MSNILDEIPKEIKPKTKNEKILLWIIRGLISLIGIIAVVSAVSTTYKLKFESFETKLNEAKSSNSNMKKEIEANAKHLDNRIDNTNIRIDNTNIRIDKISTRIDEMNNTKNK